MRRDEPTYFTGADAEIQLLSHPDEQWRGHTVDCAFFQLTSGTTPVHLWNYARRDGPTMRSYGGEGAASLQSGSSGGAPFDDTAVGNLVVELQLVINERRFKDTYYQFRSMSEIGDMQIKYSQAVSVEETKEAGYRLIDGRVQQVGRDVSVDNTTNPSLQIKFRNIRPLGERVTYRYAASAGQDTARQQAPELAAEGLTRGQGEPAFKYRPYAARVNGKDARPQAIDDWPDSLEGFDAVEDQGIRTATAESPDQWIQGSFVAPIVITEKQGNRKVWRYTGQRYTEASADAGRAKRILDQQDAAL